MKLKTWEKWYEFKKTILKPFDWIEIQCIRIARVIRWIPKVYTTPSFESGYALDFFMWKLAEVRKVIDKNRRHVGDEHKVRRMWEFEQVLKRILDEDYSMQIYKDDEHGDLEFGEPDKHGLCELKITMPPLKECVMTQDSLKQYEHAEMLYKQDIDFLASYMKKYFRGWWD